MARFTDLPLEIVEPIFGMIPFVDIKNLRSSSPYMTQLFKRSKYAIKYGIMCDSDKKNIHKAMKKFPAQQAEWTIHQVLDTYTRSYCQHCGDFGHVFMWANIPTMKLCVRCAREEQSFKALKLNYLEQHYHFKQQDLRPYPILSSKEGSYILNHAWCSIPKVRRRRVKDIFDSSNGPMQRAFMGCVKLNTWFHNSQSIPGVICSFCDKGDSHPQKIPYHYETLREHISIRHAARLTIFDSGWTSLSPELKDRLLNPTPANRCQYGYFDKWQGWPDFIHRHSMPATDRYAPQREMEKILEEKVEHAGVLFGLPEDEVEMSLREEIIKLAISRFQCHLWQKAQDCLREVLEKDGIEAFKRFQDKMPLVEIDMKLVFPEEEKKKSEA